MTLDRPSPPASAPPAWRNQLDLLLASSDEGIFAIDLQGLCNFINNAAVDPARQSDHAQVGERGDLGLKNT